MTIVLATVSSYAIGWFLFLPVLVPILNTLASYPFMVTALHRRALRSAVAQMLVWALTMGACATAMSYRWPDSTDRLFVRGQAYRIEMHTWVMTGHGAESTPSAFIPQQAGHALVFSALALATGGALAMPMGAVLMNYMGHYVGTLAAISPRPFVVMMLGWHPWAVIRIISFVIIGVVLSQPLVSLIARPSTGSGRAALSTARGELVEPRAVRLLMLACAGLVLDIVLKTLLAPSWQRALLRLISR